MSLIPNKNAARSGPLTRAASTPPISTGTFRKLVIGVGSPHGEDAAGWEVISELSSALRRCTTRHQRLAVDLHKAAVPHQVLDWLQRDSSVHIIDASLGGPQSVCRFKVQCEGSELVANTEPSLLATPASECIGQEITILARHLRSNSSHQLDLLAVLQLAVALERFPNELVLWTLPICTTECGAEIGAASRAHIRCCAERIAQDLLCA